MRLPFALYILFAAFSAVSARGQTYGELRTHIVREEGYSVRPYMLRGVWHSGIGHRVYDVPRTLSHKEVESLFARDLRTACDTAYDSVKTFSHQPKNIRVMLVALAFSVGPTGFRRFVSFRAAIDAYDYRAAARELRKSLWYNQLTSRGQQYVTLLNAQAAQP